MNFGKALYFPNIHFRDENWLKYSLFYWDGIKRIVPPDYQPHDSPEVELLVKEGLIEGVDPRSKSGTKPYTQGAADEFVPTIKELMRTRGNLNRGHLVGAGIEANAPNALIHAQKMDRRVFELLRDCDLVRQEGDWYRTDSDLAGYYMLCLAAHISQKQNAPMLSDSFEAETGGTYFQHSRPSRRAADTQGQNDIGFALARMVLPVPRPNSLADVPMKKILGFHKQYGDQRRQFRNAIETLTKDAAGLDDKMAIRDLLEDRKTTITTALDDQAKTMDELGVGVVTSLMAVSVPSGAVALASHFDPVVTSIAAGVTVALSLVGWFAKSRGEKRKAVRSSDWHFLLSVAKNFDTEEVAREARPSLNQFILD